jgi:hypothetical protein
MWWNDDMRLASRTLGVEGLPVPIRGSLAAPTFTVARLGTDVFFLHPHFNFALGRELHIEFQMHSCDIFVSSRRRASSPRRELEKVRSHV